jgi:two-component system, chemotaxis family, chemotaxis protein CheY
MRLADLDVVIVDDHEVTRTLLLQVLERAGVEKVRASADAKAALIEIAEELPDLILVDQTMPGMDGLTFIRVVRSDFNFEHVRIIMITGRAESAQADAARSAGADAVLVKPVSPRELLATIERVLGV